MDYSGISGLLSAGPHRPVSKFIMRHTPIGRLILPLAILVAMSVPTATAPAGESKLIISRTSQSDTQLYVGVMGQVARPGVFELPGPLPQLREFLNLAGGITTNASGSIRVIRAGRSNQFFLSPRFRLQLLPDDLVIVESKQFISSTQQGNTSAANGWQRNTGTLSAGPTAAVVQIGLVNLISRPVILDIPSEQANLAKVLSLLHQPVRENGVITVFRPGSGMQNVPVDQALEASLATGVALVFDPATVNSSVLPRFPNTIRPESNVDAPITRTSGEPAATHKTVSEAGRKVPPKFPVSESPSVPKLVSTDDSEPDRPVPNLGTAGRASGAFLPVTEEPAAPAGQAADMVSDRQDMSTAPETVEPGHSDAEVVAALNGPVVSNSTWIVLLAIAACGVGLAVRSRSKQRVRPVVTAELPKPIEQKDESHESLESLISGDLPVVEEPLQLPYEYKIFGRPLQTSPHRTDPAQALTGPHFAADPLLQTGTVSVGSFDLPRRNQTLQDNALFQQVNLPATAAIVINVPTEYPTLAPAERKVRFDARHPRSTAGVLERALATVAGEQP